MKKMLIVPLLVFMIASCKKDELPISNSANSGLPPQPHDTTYHINFPAVIGAARTFNFLSQSSYPVRGYTTRSRYVLYDDGTFRLQYADNGGFEYHGRYTKANSAITFEWEGWSVAGPWGATGTIRGDTLTVAYNTIMMLSDFEDAIYLREP